MYFIYSDLIDLANLKSTNYFYWFSIVVEKSNIQSLGIYLYTYFSFFLVIAGLILLVAMIGAISLTLEDPFTNSGSRHQQLFKQVSIKPYQSLFYVK